MKKQCVIFLIIAAICIVGALSVLAIWLFKPIENKMPSVEQYRDSEYYEIIQKLNIAKYNKSPKYKNNFHKYILDNKSDFIFAKKCDCDERPTLPQLGVSNKDDENIIETQMSTSNEAKKIEYSDKYIFHMNSENINIYSIDKENSKLVGSYMLGEDKGFTTDFCLSKDFKSLIIIYSTNNGRNEFEIKALDISNPEQIKEKKTIYVSGGCIAVKNVDGDILLVSKYSLSNIDFSDESTFIPQINTGTGYKSLSASSIVVPENVTDTIYMQVTKIDSNSLEIIDSQAYLSYTKNVYINTENVYLLHDSGENNAKTEIVSFGYISENFVRNNTITIEGSIDRVEYFDEYEGILRVFTNTSTLYCIDLSSWQIVSVIDKFDASNERLRFVRFNKEMAYAYMGERDTGSIYAFDLSDIANITYKKIEKVDGYTDPFVVLGNEYFADIGYEGNRNVKIEVYKENVDGMESVCKFTQNNGYINIRDEKAYYINKEEQLIGLSIEDINTRNHEYVLLKFDGEKLVELVRQEIDGNQDFQRGVFIEGYFYMFGEEDFKVIKLDLE